MSTATAPAPVPLTAPSGNGATLAPLCTAQRGTAQVEPAGREEERRSTLVSVGRGDKPPEAEAVPDVLAVPAAAAAPLAAGTASNPPEAAAAPADEAVPLRADNEPEAGAAAAAAGPPPAAAVEAPAPPPLPPSRDEAVHAETCCPVPVPCSDPDPGACPVGCRLLSTPPLTWLGQEKPNPWLDKSNLPDEVAVRRKPKLSAGKPAHRMSLTGLLPLVRACEWISLYLRY